ncbi:MAG: GtrA family protein [Gloeomargaritaceae cyanobacterium C42_A2020_066]|nr:GtrA family protein [Gloeomargaritaceae cyanobacterium C42_A2020_066]
MEVAPQGSWMVPPRPAGRVQLSLVIPTLNESHSLSTVLVAVIATLDTLLPGAYEVIVVDDNSPDGTGQVAMALQRRYPQVRGVCRQTERGLATAVLRGWQVAEGAVLGVMDGDGQHPPETLVGLWQALEPRVDLVVASRHQPGGGVRGWAGRRRVASRVAQGLGWLLLPEVVGRVSDPLSGFFLVRRPAVAGIPYFPHGYKILVELLGRGQIGSIREVGYHFQARPAGRSKVQPGHIVSYLLHLVRLRTAVGGLGRFLRFALVGAGGTLVDMGLLYLLHDPAGPGWPLALSKTIAAEVAILHNFLWHDHWTFRDRRPAGRAWWRRLLSFNLVCLGGVLLSILLLEGLVRLGGWPYLRANLATVVLVCVWNFGVNNGWTWRSVKS